MSDSRLQRSQSRKDETVYEVRPSDLAEGAKRFIDVVCYGFGKLSDVEEKRARARRVRAEARRKETESFCREVRAVSDAAKDVSENLDDAVDPWRKP